MNSLTTPRLRVSREAVALYIKQHRVSWLLHRTRFSPFSKPLRVNHKRIARGAGNERARDAFVQTASKISIRRRNDDTRLVAGIVFNLSIVELPYFE